MLSRVTEKKERSLGTKLFLKAERCGSQKCVTARRPTRPGTQGTARRRKSPTDFGRQLHEKQKMQIVYGLTNRQIKNLFQHGSVASLPRALEHRLDRVVYLLGFAMSFRIARQLVSHGHIMVNGRKVTIPSFHVKVNDRVSVRQESRSSKIFEGVTERLKHYTPPTWLSLINIEELTGECLSYATLEDMHLPADVEVVQQFYSR